MLVDELKSVSMNFGCIYDGKIVIDLAVNNSSLFEIAIMSDSKKVLRISTDSEGRLQYCRSGVEFKTPNPLTVWTKISDVDVIPFGKKFTIGIDLPKDRTSNYFRILIDGQYIGMALYDVGFEYFTAIEIQSYDKECVVIDNIMLVPSDGVVKIGQRNEKAAVAYLPEMVPATVGTILNDVDAQCSSCTNFGIGGNFFFNARRDSLVFDLGQTTDADAIRIITDAVGAIVDIHLGDFFLYYSSDNANWLCYNSCYGAGKYLQYNTYDTEDGKRALLIEFTGLPRTRYVKLQCTSNLSLEDGIHIADIQKDVRIEHRIDREYQLGADVMLLQNDINPLLGSMVRDYHSSNFQVKGGSSIGLCFGIIHSIEAIDIITNENSDLLSNIKIYASNDNITYRQVNYKGISYDTNSFGNVYRFCLDPTECVYVKLYNSSFTSFVITREGIHGYSSIASAFGGTVDILGTNKRNSEGDIIALSDGTLLMSYNNYIIARGESANDGSDCQPGVVRSIDGGYTWETCDITPIHLSSYQENDSKIRGFCNGKFIRFENGNIGLILMEIKKTIGGSINEENANAILIVSNDEGKTWGSVRSMVPMYDHAYTIFASGNCVTRLSTGRILLGVNLNVYANDCWGDERSVSVVYYSDDEGDTWNASKGYVSLPHAALEPCMTEMGDSRILMTMRTRKEGKVYQAISEDGGITWAQAEAVVGLVTPSSCNEVLTVPGTKDILLVWNNEYATDNGQRKPITFALSSDYGKTYGNIRNFIEDRVSFMNLVFYGRKLFVNPGWQGASAFVTDISDLYTPISDTRTTADLTQAPTPNADYDASSCTLFGLLDTIKLSIDNGKTWFFGGRGALTFSESIAKNIISIQLQNIGDSTCAPSEVQTIVVC